MPRSEHSKSFSVNTQGQRITQTEKMQRESDNYTKKYEWQRRNLMTLKGVQANLQEQVKNLKESVTKLKRQSEHGEVKLMFTKRRNLQKQIDINDKRYNDTVGDIDRLRTDITLLRQQKQMYLKNLKSLESDIQKADNDITKMMNSIQTSQNTSKSIQQRMLQQKMQNEKERTQYIRQINKLNRQLRDPKFIQGSRIKTGEVTAIQNDTATVLKQRLTKLIINNKEKVKLIDTYQRNMKVIDQAFNTIKQATGLTDIEEIQNTFIKGQQQNYNLLTYVDVLNQQIDTIVDTNDSLRSKNTVLKIQNSEKQRILTGTPDDEKKRKKIQSMTDTRKTQINDFQECLNKIQPTLKEALIKLAGSKFNKGNPHKIQQYENSGVPLNDNTLSEYLSELQDYTNDILLYRGKSMNQPNSQLYAKTLLLEELTPKEFKKRITDNTPLYGALDETKQKTKGFERLLDRNSLQDMAKKDLDKTKISESIKKKK